MEEGNSASDPTISFVAAVVQTAYRITWKDFYVWEQDHCQQTLQSLGRNVPNSAPQTGFNKAEHDTSVARRHSRATTPTETPPDSEDERFTVWEFGAADDAPVINTLSVETCKVPHMLEPCAPYEVCTPASRNINVGDDSEYMPFIPLTDDPKFNHVLHAGDYRYFEWQLPNRDPDLEVIVSQTVHKLHTSHRLSLRSIDETKLLPFSLLSSPRGLLYTSRRRDFPKWPKLGSTSSPLPYISPHAAAGPNEMRPPDSSPPIDVDFATTKVGDYAMPEPIPATLPSTALAHSLDTPCGPECFLLACLLRLEQGTFWSSSDVDLLHTVLSLSPDLSPCTLASICRKPCQEVFKKRRRIFSDTDLLPQNDRVKARPITMQHYSLQTGHVPIPAHVTPGRNAHVSSTTPTVKVVVDVIENVIVGGEDALARKAGIVRHAGHRDVPVIVPIRSERKRTEVRQSRWGLGLYLAEDVSEKDFIIEYTGELIYDLTTICRDFVSKHRGRTYLFQLNPTVSVDSSKAGNESRFINHAPLENANCHACVRLVNGEHRIGLFALKSCKAGMEVLLDYGDLFFQSDGVGEGAEASKPPEPSLEFVYQLDQHSSDETYSE
ncbi:Histone-lysine N-methyltransferase EZH1 [Hypsizygus marmoreus]|uniref:Histone-lysine N-methyltransferase EZH1 n=1 Tax=Hypsizygus marmoreus TaxID=39966 RepID=A0A369JBS4_HYPMA|nr:Histone-lysine N-methyltransferase EZH1 [Hypsizygus marmoreus]